MHELLEKFTKFAGEYFVNMNHEGCEISGLEYSAELRNLPDLHEVFQQNFDVGNSNKLFYFNANHLGSGSLITDGNGNPYQTLAYAPYGEVLLDVRGGSYNEPHQFTGHERDQETGLNYAHARYYWSDLSIFTSVDPLAEKYPNMSPYVYCAGNPVKYVDPTGMEVEITGEQDAAMQVIQKQAGTSVTFTLDKKYGCLSYQINDKDNISGFAHNLITAIDNPDVTLHLDSRKDLTTSNGGTMNGGAFMGNTVTKDINENSIHVDAYQEINFDFLNQIDEGYGNPNKSSVRHEITECYKAALNSYKSGNNASPAYNGVSNPAYDIAHKSAYPQSPIYKYSNNIYNGVYYTTKYSDKIGVDVYDMTGWPLYKYGQQTVKINTP